jgi:transcriptional accessory protein Tex/SPT6
LIVEVENFISNTTVEMKDTKESIEEAHDILSRLLN